MAPGPNGPPFLSENDVTPLNGTSTLQLEKHLAVGRYRPEIYGQDSLQGIDIDTQADCRRHDLVAECRGLFLHLVYSLSFLGLFFKLNHFLCGSINQLACSGQGGAKLSYKTDGRRNILTTGHLDRGHGFDINMLGVLLDINIIPGMELILGKHIVLAKELRYF